MWSLSNFQKNGCTLSDLRGALGEPILDVTVGKSFSESSSYQKRLGKHYIDPNSAIVPGVTELQRVEVSLMRGEETMSAENYKWLNAKSLQR